MKTLETFIHIDKRDQFIRDMANAFKKSRILFTSLELDIFTVIGNESKSCKNIAEQIAVNEKALERLLNALVSLGFLNKKVGQFSNKVESLLFLSKESPNYLGDLMHIASLWENWSRLTDTIKIGRPPAYEELSDKDEEWLEASILSSYRETRIYADRIVKQIPLQNPSRMLELGAGSANFSIEFAKVYPRLTSIAYELPKIAPITQKFINRSGLSDRVSTLAGNFLTDDLGQDYDFVLISDVIAEYSFPVILKLIKKVYDTMKYGGVIAIIDSFFNDDRTGDEEAIMKSLNMLVNTLDGDVLNDTDIWFTLREAWFTDIYKIETNFGKSIVIGFK
jgi:SAM-dependent methyltransferase